MHSDAKDQTPERLPFAQGAMGVEGIGIGACD